MAVARTVIERNLRLVRERIAIAAQRAGRDPAAVTLVAVAKTVGLEEIKALYDLGQRDFGENRVQQGVERVRATADLPARWHMIGHLQRNKVKPALEAFGLIHSVDSERLAAEIDRRAAERGEIRDVLLEVNISGEDSKHGLSPVNVPSQLTAISSFTHVRVTGLMTMAPYGIPADAVRPIFRQLRKMRDNLQVRFPNLQHLSMGMSQDYEIAVEEGADFVRVGTALFTEVTIGT